MINVATLIFLEAGTSVPTFVTEALAGDGNYFTAGAVDEFGYSYFGQEYNRLIHKASRS